MKSSILSVISLFGIIIALSGCTRDLSSKTYTSDATLSLRFKGEVQAVAPVIIKEHGKLSDNDGLIRTWLGNSAEGLVGSVIYSSLSRADGLQYLILVDPAQLKGNDYYDSHFMREAIDSIRTMYALIVIQSKNNPLNVGDSVYVIVSSKRARAVPRNLGY